MDEPHCIGHYSFSHSFAQIISLKLYCNLVKQTGQRESYPELVDVKMEA